MNSTQVKKLSEEFLEHIYDLPDGRKINQCIQCGTCSASCPTSDDMEYSPREIIASLRAGLLERVLGSNTVWFCASCYLCTVRCPAGIPFTDVMYELKRLGSEKGLCHEDATSATMAKVFTKSIKRHGRLAEAEMMRNYFLHTNPFGALAQTPLAMKLFFRGRLHVLPKNIKGIKGLRKMLAAVEENEK